MTSNVVIQPTISASSIAEVEDAGASEMESRDLRDHIYLTPDFLLSTDRWVDRTALVFDFTTGKLVDTVLNLPACIQQVMLELTANVIDEVRQVITALKLTPGDAAKVMVPSKITIDKNRVTFRNSWIPRQGELSIAYSRKRGKYIPELAFGNLLTSAHYTQAQNANIGKHGIGSKAANIFSTKFRCFLSDGIITHKRYYQNWTDNMTKVSTPHIEDYIGNESFVELSFELDFKRFNIAEYPDCFFPLMTRIAHDVALVTKIPVDFTASWNVPAHDESGFVLNDKTGMYHQMIYYKESSDYTKLLNFDKESVATHVITVKGDGIYPAAEIVLMDTPKRSKIVSFANGNATTSGGTHVEGVVHKISHLVIEIMKEKLADIERKRSKSLKKGDDAKIVKFPLTIADVKPHISYLILVNVVNPGFDSQIKTHLTYPNFEHDIPISEIDKLTKWKLFDKLIDLYEMKQEDKLKKVEGRGRFKQGKDLEDANNAKKMIGEPALFINEGKSAFQYSQVLFGVLGRDNFGAFPARGKFLNSMNADKFQIADNEEFKNISNAVGLRRDTNYLDDENYRKLRYKYIIGLVDADPDGLHIAALFMLYLHVCYPTFLARPGTVMLWKTPYLRVWKERAGKRTEVFAFCSVSEYERWQAMTPDWKSWTGYKYYKGLGTSNKQEILEDAARRRVVTCIYDAHAPHSFNVSFHKDFADERKKWLAEWAPNLRVEELQMQDISLFLYYELGSYTQVNLLRSIPCIMDGLKPSLRKAIYASFLKWGDTLQKHVGEIKVADLAGWVGSNTNYHHGNALEGVIIGLAQDFVGANNLPYFVPDGEFGSRCAGGADHASSRYLHTRPQPWLPYIFRKEDKPLLQALIDENKEIEYKYYLPILCMIIVNGSLGIATGWSSSIPNYNPRDVISWHRCKLTGLRLPMMKPWYNGFKGTIELSTKSGTSPVVPGNAPVTLPLDVAREPVSTVADNMAVDAADEPEEADENAKHRIIVSGSFKELPNGDVVIEELPVGAWTKKYRTFLNSLCEKPQKEVDDKNVSKSRKLRAREAMNAKKDKPKKTDAEKTDKEKEKDAKKRQDKKPQLKSWDDHSDDVLASFVLHGLEFKPTLQSLHLVKTYSLDNMVLLDCNNKPVHYPTIESILETFHRLRLPYYGMRKTLMLQDIAKEVEDLTGKMKLITCILSGELVIFKPGTRTSRLRADIENDMVRLGIPIELLPATNLLKLTQEEIAKLWNKRDELGKEYETLVAISAEQLWLNDLDELERHLPY